MYSQMSDKILISIEWLGKRRLGTREFQKSIYFSCRKFNFKSFIDAYFAITDYKKWLIKIRKQ